MGNMTLIIVITILILMFGLAVYSAIWNIKESKKAQILFDTKLINLCHNAATIEDCNYAWNVLMDECINGKIFKIPKAYHQSFYELRANLQGKLTILRLQGKNTL